MEMRVSADEAMALLAGINHATFQRALPRRWRVRPNGGATIPSLCWLMVWAETGMNSPLAAVQAQTVFNQIFGVRFEQVLQRIPLAQARALRYR